MPQAKPAEPALRARGRAVLLFLIGATGTEVGDEAGGFRRSVEVDGKKLERFCLAFHDLPRQWNQGDLPVEPLLRRCGDHQRVPQGFCQRLDSRRDVDGIADRRVLLSFGRTNAAYDRPACVDPNPDSQGGPACLREFACKVGDQAGTAIPAWTAL